MNVAFIQYTPTLFGVVYAHKISEGDEAKYYAFTLSFECAKEFMEASKEHFVFEVSLELFDDLKE